MIIDCITDIAHVQLDDNSFLVVKVGNDQRPATAEDIENVQKNIEGLGLKGLKCLVTHHVVDFKVYACDKGH